MNNRIGIFVLAAFVSLASCGSDSESDTQASGGSAAVAGSSGSAGQSGSSGSAGNAGSSGGGTGGSSGHSGNAGTSGSSGEFGGMDPASLIIVADTDRDGDVDADDLPGRADWSWQRGAFLVANLDDDDEDGVSDCDDAVANGADDADDLASIRIELGSAASASAVTLHATVLEGAQNVRTFVWDGTKFSALDGVQPSAASTWLAIEANRFAGPDWDGIVRLTVEARDAGGSKVASDETVFRVAPWIVLPSSAVPTAIHVASGAYANQSFLGDLEAAATAAGVELLPPFATSHWQEMWVQDTMEIGYTQLPGRDPMHVVLRANRGQDDHAGTLLGPDMGYFQVGAPRSTTGGDAWVDWYGNLEVSPPVPGWPLGRIYYGHNTETGMMLHPDVVDFLEAQEVQAPFWIDTSWLTIKHVDEILTFVPAADGSPRMLVASPREAGLLYPGYYGAYNQGIQAKIDKAIHGGAYVVNGSTVDYEGVLSLLGLDETALIELPLFYTDGHNDWSNPINGLYLGGVYVAGGTDIFPAEREVTQNRIEALGIDVVWVDDAVYQHNLGNVHCATNATRLPVVTQFADAIPDTR